MTTWNKSAKDSSWEDIIKYYQEHSLIPHPSFKFHPACELCYPQKPNIDTTWDTFWDWYKIYFNAVNYSSKTLICYKAFRETIQNLIDKTVTQ